MAYYIKNGNMFTVTDKAAVDIYESLPAENYVVKHDDRMGFYLEGISSFILPSKLYGSTVDHAARIMQTFLDRSAATGVLLNGEKGSGKTLLGKTLAIQVRAAGFPVIVINSPFHGDGFNKFIQSIDQPAMIMFDEFEKVYDQETQPHVLTLLDGVFPTKKLFLLTVNDRWRIDNHMRNRPGRIYYSIDFHGLEETAIREYLADNLTNTSLIDEVVSLSTIYTVFNFDMLQAIVEEMNRYGEDPRTAITLLNARPEYNTATTYSMEVFVKGVRVPENLNLYNEWVGNPLGGHFHVSYYKTKEDMEEDVNEVSMSIGPDNLQRVENGMFVYKLNDHRIVLKKKPSSGGIWDKVF